MRIQVYNDHWCLFGVVMWRTLAGVIGTIAGIALHQHARTGNGFLVGPDILVAYLVLASCLICSTTFLIVRKCRLVAGALLVFSITCVGSFLLVSAIWPPPPPEPPVPL